MKSASLSFKTAYNKAKNFFGITIPSIKLFLITDVIKLKNIKQKWYEAGFFHGNNVLIVDRRFLPKLGYQKKDFDGILMHEISHIFIKNLIRKKIPIWIEEGICNYLSFPPVKPNKTARFSQLNTLEDWNKQDTPFTYCSYFFYTLQQKYGDKKICSFFQALKKDDAKIAFNKVFKISLRNAENEYLRLIKK